MEEAREGIAWIVVYKEGRGWKAACYWPDFTDDLDRFDFDPDDLAEVKAVLAADPNAIFVNGWYTNLGPIEEEMTIETLTNALRWQYESGFNLLADTV
ncbi:MAG: hypothetical protein NC311_08845 [Muribaculaceae bacterium]|nr:hypothetical protein [Muribaculaceae bacterium]